MTLEARPTGDLAALPTHAFGHRSLTWWGVMAFMAIEGVGFAMAAAAYFFLMSHEQTWPPQPVPPPDLWPATLVTLVMLLSEIPNAMLKHASEKGMLIVTRLGLVVLLLFGLLLLVLRGFEFASLNVRWTDNAYGSVLWMLLLLHTVHLLTDLIDSAVLTALMFTPQSHEPRRWVDVSENALYWRFVWLTWLPIYLLIYWVPRWVA